MKEIKFHEQSEGWTVEYSHGCIAHIKRPEEQGGGYVSIDFANRAFDIGHCRPRRSPYGTVYKGRGWKEQIITDAVARLTAV